MTPEAVVTAVIAIVGVIVWLVRLEGRLNYVEKKSDTLQIKHDALDSKIVEELGRLREGVAELKGYLQKSRES